MMVTSVEKSRRVVVLSDRLITAAVGSSMPDQAAMIRETLKKLGYSPVEIKVVSDLSTVRNKIREVNPFFVFNTVTSINGIREQMHAVPALLDEMNIMYTGENSTVLYTANTKMLSIKMMCVSGIEVVVEEGNGGESSRERAGCGVVAGRKPELTGCFGLLASNGRPEILPPLVLNGADTVPSYMPDEKVRIGLSTVGDFFRGESGENAAMINRLRILGLKCWKCFGLKRYALLNFKIDKNNMVKVVSVHPNPDLSLKSDFVRSALSAGYTYEGIIVRIIDEAFLKNVSAECAL